MTEDTSRPVTILVADDHWVSRTGMRHLLRGLERDVTMREAASFGEALELVANTRPLDLVVLDLLMPDRDAFEGLSAIVSAAGACPVVVLSMIEDRRYAKRAIELGAIGYIPKTGDAEETLSAIRTVLAGNAYLPADLIGAAGEGETTEEVDSTQQRIAGLTRRQREVFMRLGTGQATGQIARELEITEFTVRGHIAAILRKLGLDNKTQAALLASEIMPE